MKPKPTREAIEERAKHVASRVRLFFSDHKAHAVSASDQLDRIATSIEISVAPSASSLAILAERMIAASLLSFYERRIVEDNQEPLYCLQSLAMDCVSYLTQPLATSDNHFANALQVIERSVRESLLGKAKYLLDSLAEIKQERDSLGYCDASELGEPGNVRAIDATTFQTSWASLRETQIEQVNDLCEVLKPEIADELRRVANKHTHPLALPNVDMTIAHAKLYDFNQIEHLVPRGESLHVILRSIARRVSKGGAR